MSKRLKIAGLCLVTGLAVEALSLLWVHPLAFLAFIGGGVLITVGVLFYVGSLVLKS